jgi:hypothetical protein
MKAISIASLGVKIICTICAIFAIYIIYSTTKNIIYILSSPFGGKNDYIKIVSFDIATALFMLASCYCLCYSKKLTLVFSSIAFTLSLVPQIMVFGLHGLILFIGPATIAMQYKVIVAMVLLISSYLSQKNYELP